MGVQVAERSHVAAPIARASIERRAPAVTTLGAAAAVVLIPVWWHLTLVDPHIENVTAVFSTVGVYPSDVCLLIVAAGALRGSNRLGRAMLLPAAALLSVAVAIDRLLAASVALHLVLLTAAGLAIRVRGASSTWITSALVTAAALESVLAVAQFVTQQPLVPAWLGLPWLPGPDVSVGGTPVVLDADGQRLFRGFGTFPHPNVLGGYLALALVALPLLPRRCWPVALVLVAGLVVTFSRTSWLGAALGVSMWLVAANAPRIRKGAVVVGSLIALGALLASPVGPTIAGRISPWSGNALERGSIGNRLQLDLDGLAEARAHLPFGVGAGNVGLAVVRDGFQVGWGEPTPNVALLIATELGLPGLVAAFTLAAAVIGVASRRGATGAPLLAVCSAVAVLAMLDHYLWSMPPGRVMAWVPLALVAAQRHTRSQRQALPR